jgi:hypothetical protein
MTDNTNINHTDDTKDLYLSNMENYYSKYGSSVNKVFEVFTRVIYNYIDHCIKTIYISNPKYLHYVLDNGINVLHNIFSLIYLYTKNLEIAKQYTEKGYYIYCEFIGKIGDNNHKYLQLNSKDATLFVLKKTIYELNNTYTRTFTFTKEEEEHINNITQKTELYIQCVKSFITISYVLKSISKHIPKKIDATKIDLFPLNILTDIANTILNIESCEICTYIQLKNILINTFKNPLDKYSYNEYIKYLLEYLNFNIKYSNNNNRNVYDIINLLSSNDITDNTKEIYENIFKLSYETINNIISNTHVDYTTVNKTNNVI